MVDYFIHHENINYPMILSQIMDNINYNIAKEKISDPFSAKVATLYQIGNMILGYYKKQLDYAHWIQETNQLE